MLSVALFAEAIAASQMFFEFWIRVGESFKYPSVSKSK